MQFRQLAEAFETIEATSKRLEMTSLLVDLLRSIPKPLLDKVTYLMQGKLYPDFEGVELGVAEKLTIKAIARTYGVTEAHVEELRKKTGDVGLAAESVAGERKQRSIAAEPLTAAHVYATFERIAKASGAGSQDQKIGGLSELLHGASPGEAKYLVRLATGRLRLGVADQTVIDALTILTTGGAVGSITELEEKEREEREAAKEVCQRALDVSSDLGLVVRTAMESGLAGLRRLRLRMGVPLRPMLAERAETLEEALERMPGTAFVEYKYDGLRMQGHVGKEVRIFSRRLENMTSQFPDVVKALRDAFPRHEVIVEGETVAVDPKTGRVRPFQEVSQRRGRKYGLGSENATLTGKDAGRDVTKEIPVRLFLFDLLWADGDEFTQRPLRERRAALEKLCKPNDGVSLGALKEMKAVREIEDYFDEVTSLGAEGIMIKSPDSTYQAGSRGYSWIKFKADYQAGVVDTMDLVAVGAYWGQGRRGGWYGTLLMACHNVEKGTFESVCRLATGFDDATLADLEKRFAPYVLKEKHKLVETGQKPDVWLEPKAVLEVQGAELTLSPNHRCAWDVLKEGAGLSVRFPRFTGRWREDKGPRQATTTAEIVKMFEIQRKKQR